MRLKEDCYWYWEDHDMGARIPFCTARKGSDPLETCDGCGEYHSKHRRTQGDRIRSMSDRELAFYLHAVQTGGGPATEGTWLRMLQSEVVE